MGNITYEDQAWGRAYVFIPEFSINYFICKSEQILWVVNLSPYLHIKTFAPHETKVHGISHIAFMG